MDEPFDDGSGAVLTAALRVHTALGPGLLEGAYEACLALELRAGGLRVRTQAPISLLYHGVRIQIAYKADLLVDDKLIVELKTVTKILPVHEAQLLSYLRLSRVPVGLLINFSALRLKDGIRRKVNSQVPSAAIANAPPRHLPE